MTRTRVLTAAGAVVVAVLTAGVTTALHTAPTVSPSLSSRSSATSRSEPTALSAVTSALARTSARSYTFSLDTTARLSKRELNSERVSGAYDPERHLGTEVLIGHSAQQTTRAQIRFVGAHLYTSVTPGSGFGKPWDKTPIAAAAATRLPPGDLYGFVSDQAVSPSALTSVLRSAGAAVRASGPASGPGWTGISYTFTARFFGGLESVNGTVDVDVRGQVRSLATTTIKKGRNALASDFITTTRDITFGTFGAPVWVKAPPASQVEFTSGKPYWGFYF